MSRPSPWFPAAAGRDRRQIAQRGVGLEHRFVELAGRIGLHHVVSHPQGVDRGVVEVFRERREPVVDRVRATSSW